MAQAISGSGADAVGRSAGNGEANAPMTFIQSGYGNRLP